MTENPAVVLDNGSVVFKAGIAGEDEPSVVIPTIFGKLRKLGARDGIFQDFYVGDEAQEHRDVVDLKYPIERGLINDWDAMEKIWHYVFHSKLKVDPEGLPVLLTEVPHNHKAYRERMAEIMFEKFKTPALNVSSQSVLSLYSSGRMTGIVLDCGDGVSNAVPVYQGHAIPNAMSRLDVAGKDLTDYLTLIIGERELERGVVTDMKEKLAYIALDFDHEMRLEKSSIEKTYDLPDGRTITVDNERFRCAEALFKPSFVGLDGPGIHDIVYKSIMKCDMDTRKSLYSNIILSGGTTLCPGFENRLNKEISALAPQSVRVKVTAPQERRWPAWAGGSSLAMMLSKNNTWVTKQQYDENGPPAIN